MGAATQEVLRTVPIPFEVLVLIEKMSGQATIKTKKLAKMPTFPSN